MRKPRTHSRSQKAKRHKRKNTPGPKPDVLKIEGDWQDAVKKSLAKRKPAQGWAR